MNSLLISALPFEIKEPGDYHLQDDLHGPEGDFALNVAAENVSLDLRGFTLSSDAETTLLLSAPRFSLRRGVLKGAGLALVAAPHISADGCLMEDLEVEGGLFVGGRALTCRRLEVRGGTYGIKAGEEAHLSHCKVEDCLLLGVEVAAGSRMERCTVKTCEEGVYAFGSREQPSHLEKVVVYECRGLGLRLDGPGVLHECEAHHNGREEPSGGILAGPASVVRQCEAYHNNGGDIAVVEPCELSSNRTSDGSGI